MFIISISILIVFYNYFRHVDLINLIQTNPIMHEKILAITVVFGVNGSICSKTDSYQNSDR